MFTQAVALLRLQFLRAVSDRKYGRVGVTISLEGGAPTHFEDAVSGTHRRRKQSV